MYVATERGTSNNTEATRFSQCAHDQRRRLEAKDCDSIRCAQLISGGRRRIRAHAHHAASLTLAPQCRLVITDEQTGSEPSTALFSPARSSLTSWVPMYYTPIVKPIHGLTSTFSPVGRLFGTCRPNTLAWGHGYQSGSFLEALHSQKYTGLFQNVYLISKIQTDIASDTDLVLPIVWIRADLVLLLHFC